MTPEKTKALTKAFKNFIDTDVIVKVPEWKTDGVLIDAHYVYESFMIAGIVLPPIKLNIVFDAVCEELTDSSQYLAVRIEKGILIMNKKSFKTYRPA